jgi:hypothetical protein
MKRFPPKFSSLLITLLILLVAGQGFAASFILCFQESGHSAFEQAGECSESAEPCCDNSGDSLTACDHCGPCHDVSVLSDALHGRCRGDLDLSTPAPLPVIIAAPAPAVEPFIRDLTANLSPQPPPYPCTTLISLRTVVLLN